MAYSDSRTDHDYRWQEAPVDFHRGFKRSALYAGCGQGAFATAAFCVGTCRMHRTMTLASQWWQSLRILQVADLVLVLVDGHFGFEMETFELLNVLQVGDSFARALHSALTSVHAVRAPLLGARWTDIPALKVHGFPKVMGILTHLDQFTNTKQLKKTKKQLKANQIACVCLHAERTASNRRELELL